MKAEGRNVASDRAAVYREISTCGLPAWVWRELHSVKTAAGDDRSGVLVIREGDYPLVVMTRNDLDMLIARIREEGDEA